MMKISAPLYVLKNRAKDLKRSQNISHSEALNQIAMQEGYSSWSLLMSKCSQFFPEKYSDILEFLNNGDLVLVAARPGVGKVLFCLGLMSQAIEADRPTGRIYSLSEREADMRSRLSSYMDMIGRDDMSCSIDCSDEICADYIIEATADVSPGSLILVDYLQMLDERRSTPPIQSQVEKLKEFALEKSCIIIFICQLHKRIHDRTDQRPNIGDIRLPNHLDLKMFNKMFFLSRETPQAEVAEVFLHGAEHRSFKIGLDLKKRRFFDLS